MIPTSLDILTRAICAVPVPKNPVLTPQEYHVLELVAEGLTTPEIAKLLKLSPKTIDNHRTNLMRKLQVTNAVQAARLYWVAHWRMGKKLPIEEAVS